MICGMCALFAASQVVPAAAGSYGTELPFVLGTGARIAGMGISGISYGSDATVQYYNPAGLTYLESKQFVFYKSTLFEEQTAYNALTYAQPLLNQGTVAISILRVDVGGIEERSNTNQLLSDDLHNSQTRVLLGYSRPFGDMFAAGFNVKIDNQTFGTYSGSGVGLDVGLSAQQNIPGTSFIKGVREGLMIRNLMEPSVKLDLENVSDPMSIGLGVSMIAGIDAFLLVTALELENPRYSPVTFHLGQEIRYMDRYSLRFGVDGGAAAFGFGGEYRNLALDYAYRNSDFGGSHRFSFSVTFGTSLSEQRASVRLQREQEVNETINKRMDELERSQIDRAMEQGRSLLADKDYEAALEHFDIALLWEPDNAIAMNLANQCQYEEASALGRSEMDNNNYVGALVYLKKALQYAPGDNKTLSLVGICNRKIAETEDSAAAIERTLKTAIDLYAQARYADAMAGFQEVLNISPRNEFAREYHEKCLMSIQSIVERRRRDARALVRKGNYDGAIRLMREALAYNPQHGGVRAEMAEYERQRAEQAAADSRPPTPTPQPELTKATLPSVAERKLDTQYNEGMKHFNNGQFDLAIQTFIEVWSVDPEYHNVTAFLTKAYLLVGMNYYSEQNYDEAISTWGKVLTIDPDNNKARRYLSKANEEIRKLSGVYNDG